MGVVPDIGRAWRDPVGLMADKLSSGPREDRALATLMGASALMFVSRWPDLSRSAHLAHEAAVQSGQPLDQVPGLQALMGINLFVFLFIFPLLAYGLAGFSALVARGFGLRIGGFAARMALFWALLAVAPLMLLHGLVAGFLGQGQPATIIGLLVFFGFSFLWLRLIRAASRVV